MTFDEDRNAVITIIKDLGNPEITVGSRGYVQRPQNVGCYSINN